MVVDLKIKNRAALDWSLAIYTDYNSEDVSIVVYDITQRHSFEEAKELVDEFTQEAKPDAFVALVGNKADLEGSREVSFEVSNVAMFI